MNNTIIRVSVRSSYGNERIYPENLAAQVLTQLTCTKTLSIDNLKSAAALGLEIQLVDGFSTATGKEIEKLTHRYNERFNMSLVVKE